MTARSRGIVLTLTLSAIPLLPAQTAPKTSATTTVTSENAVLLTPFEVSTDKDRGYAAGNTLSGSRADNAAGNYRFTEGALKGFGVNAGVNYRGYTKVGSRDAQIKFGTTAPTVVQTAQAAYDYLWVEPTWAVTAGANYTRRFGKVQARIQVNIANLLIEDDPQWRANNSGGYSVINANQLLNGNPRMQVLSCFNQLDPRKYTLTTTLSF